MIRRPNANPKPRRERPKRDLESVRAQAALMARDRGMRGTTVQRSEASEKVRKVVAAQDEIRRSKLAAVPKKAEKLSYVERRAAAAATSTSTTPPSCCSCCCCYYRPVTTTAATATTTSSTNTTPPSCAAPTPAPLPPVPSPTEPTHPAPLRYNQPELLAEAVVTEAANVRFLLEQKRRSMAKEESEALRREQPLAALASRFHAKRGTLASVVFPHVDLMPPILADGAVAAAGADLRRRRKRAAAVCAVTGKPAKYMDPLSGKPYADAAAFKVLREQHAVTAAAAAAQAALLKPPAPKKSIGSARGRWHELPDAPVPAGVAHAPGASRETTPAGA